MFRFTLVYTAFATAVYRPGHGSLSPLALGLTVYVATVAGGGLPQKLQHPVVACKSRCRVGQQT